MARPDPVQTALPRDGPDGEGPAGTGSDASGGAGNGDAGSGGGGGRGPGPDGPDPPAEVLTVAEVSTMVQRWLSANEDLRDVWVEGEAAGIHRSDAGHLYFKLKDDRHALKVAVFRWEDRDVADFDEGSVVLVRGDLDTYAARSEYQLVGKEVRAGGMGALYERFLKLKAKLDEEGLFAPERKRPLPRIPRTVGVVTSPRGAAIRDVITVARRRYPNVNLLVAPTLVQGPGAAHQVAEAIRRQERAGRADVLIVGRGGGSLEDLWAFNEEVVARAIAACPIPVVSAVGHETDVTIADLVADLRAPTPSAAAELVVPDKAELVEQVRAKEHLLARDLRRLAVSRRRQLDSVLRRSGLVRPERMVEERAQRVDDLERSLRRGLEDRLVAAWQTLSDAEVRLRLSRPDRLLERRSRRVEDASRALAQAFRDAVGRRRERLVGARTALRSLSPLEVLDRGYTVVRRPDGTPVTRAGQTAVEEELDVTFADGRVRSRVEDVRLDGTGSQEASS